MRVRAQPSSQSPKYGQFGKTEGNLANPARADLQQRFAGLAPQFAEN